jgi:hypothetical protein
MSRNSLRNDEERGAEGQRQKQPQVLLLKNQPPKPLGHFEKKDDAEDGNRYKNSAAKPRDETF